MSIEPPLDPALTAPSVEPQPTSVSAAEPGPRIRWAGIVWGAIFALVAALSIAILADPARRSDVRDRLIQLDLSSVHPGAVVGYVAIAVGVLLLVLGGIALLRRTSSRA